MTEELWATIVGRLNEVQFLTSARIYRCKECEQLIPKGERHIVDEKQHYHIRCWKNEPKPKRVQTTL